MIRGAALAALLAAGAALCGCTGIGAQIGRGPDLVSAQSPPGTGPVNDQSEPQSQGSLPPGAAVSGPGPFATQPNLLSLTLGRRS